MRSGEVFGSSRVPKGMLRKNNGLYLVAVFVMTYYGIEVCPFLNQIDLYELVVEMSVGLGLAHAGKLVLTRSRVDADEIDLVCP